MPDGQLLYQRFCLRIVKDHVLVYVGTYSGAESPAFDKNFQDLIEGITITE